MCNIKKRICKFALKTRLPMCKHTGVKSIRLMPGLCVKRLNFKQEIYETLCYWC